MTLGELTKYTDYDIQSIEFYNEFGELEYVANLYDIEFDDIDIVYGRWFETYGVIKLNRNGQARLNNKSVQPPKSKL